LFDFSFSFLKVCKNCLCCQFSNLLYHIQNPPKKNSFYPFVFYWWSYLLLLVQCFRGREILTSF
jgi:hypothetical protein